MFHNRRALRSAVRRPFVAAVSGFTPADLPNLLAWYKADVGVTPGTADADTATWADQSLNGYNLNDLGSANGLTCRLATLNSRSVLENSGTGDHVGMTQNTNPVSLGGTVLSVFAVLKFTGGGSRIISIGPGTDDTGSGFCFYQDALTGFHVYFNGELSPGTVSSGTWNQIGTIFNGTNNTSYVNNVASSPVAQGAFTFGSSVNICALGNCGNGNDGIAGQIAELIVVKRAINSTERGQIAAYFSSVARWGV